MIGLMFVVRGRLGDAEAIFPITLISGFLWTLLYVLPCADPHFNPRRSDYPCLRMQSMVRCVSMAPSIQSEQVAELGFEHREA